MTEYVIVYRPEDQPKGHSCGLITDMPEVSIGTVVRCQCGRHWKRRPNWTADGEPRWSWETRLERWRRRNAVPAS